nr:immunoglobulin light chain junction region [Macaca mulatta]MOV97226.1 immunoglobulin light chain junction region [Macaca mulatta]MOV99844.1 immunoglobulin light chain junction region [Macaca mulatta]MOW00348.1 immunoglobulin light chain junction region [Macaca mulatta]MOW00495.1 immunoglobulin light chain junction region [Macaca mulatta]
DYYCAVWDDGLNAVLF